VSAESGSSKGIAFDAAAARGIETASEARSERAARAESNSGLE
jgi:hypothetical protein